MGRIKKGILGGFSGKVGAVIGASWRGIDYMRGLPRNSAKPASEAQLAQQNKMTLLRNFLLGLDSIIETRFQNIEKFTPMNDALSYNLLNSIEGIYPEQSINFAQLLFSKGILMNAWSPKVVSVESNAIDFSWENGNFTPMRAADDLVTLVVYNPAKNQFCELEDGGSRSNKFSRLIVPENFKGDEVHCYMSFYSKTRKIASTNEYFGVILVI